MAHRINQAEIDRMRRDEDLHILASWERISRERANLLTNSPGSHRQARNVKG